ncbi:MAG TPA: hypothetical protein VGG72_00160 [Bryobacteraceae bacterium]
MPEWVAKGPGARPSAIAPPTSADRGASDSDGYLGRYLASSKTFTEQFPSDLGGGKGKLRGILVCPNLNLAEELCAAIETAGEISISLTIESYPTAPELLRAMRIHMPEILFMSFEAMEKARELVAILETAAPKLLILGVHSHSIPDIMREALRLGARDFLTPPFEQSALQQAAANLKALLRRTSESISFAPQVFSFLPSKAGVGTSTIAMNVSAAMSRPPDARALLADLDLSSGIQRFLLKLRTEHSVADALEFVHKIEDNLWQVLVTRLDDLDVLPAKHNTPHLRVNDAQIQGLIEFARSRYRVLCFDLSSNLERYSQAVMKESTRVLMVCTPELPSLQMARQKLAFLRTLGIERRVAIVLNRCDAATFTPNQVEQALGYPVIQWLPNDYLGVMDATLAGARVNARSLLGKSFVELAGKLLGRNTPAPAIESPEPLQFWSLATRALASRVRASRMPGAGSGARMIEAASSAGPVWSRKALKFLGAGPSPSVPQPDDKGLKPLLGSIGGDTAADHEAARLELRRKSLVSLLAVHRHHAASGSGRRLLAEAAADPKAQSGSLPAPQ